MKGRVKVEVYPNSSLFKDGEEMEALSLGSVQMLAPSLAKFGPLGVREFEVFDLPYLFDNYDELHKVTNGPAGAALLRKLEPKGISGLAYWDNGFKNFWDGLPADVRRELDAAMKEATLFANHIAKQENEQALEKIKASGKTVVYVPTPQDRAAWKKALAPVHKEMEGRIGRETIQAF